VEVKLGQGWEEASKFELAWENRVKMDVDVINMAWEMQQVVDEIGNEEIHTEEKKLTLDPVAKALNSLAPTLFPTG